MKCIYQARRLINHVYVCKWNRIYNFTWGVYSMCLRIKKIIKTSRTFSHSNTCTCNFGLSRLEHFVFLLLFLFTLFVFPMCRLNVVRPKLLFYFSMKNSLWFFRIFHNIVCQTLCLENICCIFSCRHFTVRNTFVLH